MFEEELACQCEVASLRVPVLLLYSRLQSMACYLPQQESKSQTFRDTIVTLPYTSTDYSGAVIVIQLHWSKCAG